MAKDRTSHGREKSSGENRIYVLIVVGLPPHHRWQEFKDGIRDHGVDHPTQAHVWLDRETTYTGCVFIQDRKQAEQAYDRIYRQGWAGRSVVVGLFWKATGAGIVDGPQRLRGPSQSHCPSTFSSHSASSRHGRPGSGTSTASSSASFTPPHTQHQPLPTTRPSYGYEFFQSNRGTNVMLNWIEYAYDSCYGLDAVSNLYPGGVGGPVTVSPLLPRLPSHRPSVSSRHDVTTPQSQFNVTPIYNQHPLVFGELQIPPPMLVSPQPAGDAAIPFRPRPSGTSSRHDLMAESPSGQQHPMTDRREARYTNRSLHFAGLPHDYVDEDVFKAMLSKYGRVERCHISLCKSGRPHKGTGVAIATFAASEAAAKALQALNGRDFPGKKPRRVHVKWDIEGGELLPTSMANGSSGSDRDMRRRKDERGQRKTKARACQDEQHAESDRRQHSHATNQRSKTQPLIVDGTGKYGSDEETEVGQELSRTVQRGRVEDGKRNR